MGEQKDTLLYKEQQIEDLKIMKQDLNSKMIQELNRNDEIEVDIRKQ